MAMSDDEAQKLFSQWLGRSMKILLKDGRRLMGQFVCTDNQRNVILAQAQEYVEPEQANSDGDRQNNDLRVLGLAMVPGRHIVKMHVDADHTSAEVS